MQIDVDDVWETNTYSECCCQLKKVQGRAIQLRDIRRLYYDTSCCCLPHFQDLRIEIDRGVTIAHTTGKVKEGIFGDSVETNTTYETTYPSVSIGFLEDLPLAKRVIELAKRLSYAYHHPTLVVNKVHVAPSAQQMRHRDSGSTMMQRMERIEDLVAEGFLSPAEAADHKVGLLQNEPDPTLSLHEMAELFKREMITEDEYHMMKSRVLSISMKIQADFLLSE